jgi:hypothetical protein
VDLRSGRHRCNSDRRERRRPHLSSVSRGLAVGSRVRRGFVGVTGFARRGSLGLTSALATLQHTASATSGCGGARPPQPSTPGRRLGGLIFIPRLASLPGLSRGRKSNRPPEHLEEVVVWARLMSAPLCGLQVLPEGGQHRPARHRRRIYWKGTRAHSPRPLLVPGLATQRPHPLARRGRLLLPILEPREHAALLGKTGRGGQLRADNASRAPP